MKLAFPLFSAAFARGTINSEDSSQITEESRIWTPDTTARIEFNLVEGALTESWSIPVDGDGNYLPNQYYRVYVTAPEGYSIRAKIADNVDIEDAGLGGVCDQDAAIFYNGPDGNFELARLCGSIANPMDVVGTRSDMTLVFKSNENVIVKTGMSVTFTAFSEPPNNLAWNSVQNAFEDIKSLVFDGHDHKRDHIQDRKAKHFQNIFSRFTWMGEHNKMPGDCSVMADVGEEADFVPPVVDENAPCDTIANFVAALRSFHYTYVCMDGIDTSVNRRMIPAKTKAMLKRQEDYLTNQKFHAMGCLLAP